MDSSLKKILRENYVDGVLHTHVSMSGLKGKFMFNRDSLENFWKVYCDLVQNDNNIFCIAEKSERYLPVLVDVDLKYRDDEKIVSGLYSKKQLQTVVEVYQSTLRQIVDNCDSKDLTCVVLEKELYHEEKNEVAFIKNGFHLHFPFLFLEKEGQEIHLIPRVQNIIKEMNLFENVVEDSSVVIDKACCKVPWLLYGSRKNDKAKPYKVTTIYDDKMEEMSLEKAFSNYVIYDNKGNPIKIDEAKIEYYLPRILSILCYGRPTKELKRGLISPLKEQLKKEKDRDKKSTINYNRLGVAESLEIARKLLPMLCDRRTEDRNDWMTVGWVLYNISDGNSEGLDLWCDFSSRCQEKYDENSCIYQWERMAKRDLGLGTLKFFAKNDSPELYRAFKEERSKKHIESSLEGSHNDIAKALFEEYSDEFVCASVSRKIWYQYRNHHWEEIEEGVFLREKISEKIVGKYTDVAKKLYDELRNCEDKVNQSFINAKLKSINKMITNLKSAPYKNNVMREAADVFYEPRFIHKLDLDGSIVCFKNGVYDLKTSLLRPGRPEDYISKVLPINYIEFSEDDEKVQDVHSFLEQVFPDKSIRKYFLDVTSDVFLGGNPEKIIVFWTGEGNNGKTVTQTLFEKMLDKLAIKLNTTIITGKKPSAGSAFADLARAGGGVRWCVLEEPDGDESISIGILKILTGNDTYYARDLYEKGKDGREITPMFKLVFICNKLPKIRYADKAIWNRVRVIPFESTFCKPDENIPATYEEQLLHKRFPMDNQFTLKIPNMVEAFAWVLLNHRKQIMHKPRSEPEKVRIATELYKKQNDVYRQFIEECIMESKESYMTLTELYMYFKDWYKESMPGHTLPIKHEIEEYFSKVWGEPEHGKKWKGYKQITDKDRIESGDIVILENGDLNGFNPEK